jgi:hypothetical protein
MNNLSVQLFSCCEDGTFVVPAPYIMELKPEIYSQDANSQA